MVDQDLNPFHREDEDSWLPRRRFQQSRSTQRFSVREFDRQLDYKSTPFLQNFLSSSGRIKSRRETRLKLKHQRAMQRAVKLARQMALIPHERRAGDQAGDAHQQMREFRAAKRELQTSSLPA